MKTGLLIAGLVLAMSTIPPAEAYYCRDGQMPAPPALAAQMALPLCGFAATKRWGANGCQLCDARNMHPNPFEEGYRSDHGARRVHGYRPY